MITHELTHALVKSAHELERLKLAGEVRRRMFVLTEQMGDDFSEITNGQIEILRGLALDLEREES